MNLCGKMQKNLNFWGRGSSYVNKDSINPFWNVPQVLVVVIGTEILDFG